MTRHWPVTLRRGRGGSGALLALACAIAVGCGGSPTSPGNSGTPNRAGAPKLEAVYAKVKGLSPAERRKALIEMAEKEGGKLNVYGSANLDEAEPIMAAFEDTTGIEPNLYRASSSDLLERILQEAGAHFKGGADVVYADGPELQVLDDKRLLLPLTSPFTKDLVQKSIVSRNWAPVYLNAFTAAWNTKRVSPAQAPRSWEGVFQNFHGKLAMEAGDWDWFATLVTQYFEKRKGMSEAEAVDLFRSAASEARMIDGHTLMTQLLGAGEFDVVADAYKHRAAQLKRKGAPVEWQPPVQPIVVRPNGVGIASDTDVPATALLFSDFMLSDVQKMLIGLDRTPASYKVPGGGIPAGYDVLIADLRTLNRERDKWEKLYEDIARQSGKVISG